MGLLNRPLLCHVAVNLFWLQYNRQNHYSTDIVDVKLASAGVQMLRYTLVSLQKCLCWSLTNSFLSIKNVLNCDTAIY